MTTMTRRMNRKRQRGFSLLEALVASSILAVPFLAFTMVSIALARGTKTADSLSAATALAQETIEQVRSQPLGTVSQNTAGTLNDASNPIRADGTAGGIFTRSWTISNRDIPTFGLRTLTVTVSWNDPLPHSMQLASYLRCSTVPCPTNLP